MKKYYKSAKYKKYNKKHSRKQQEKARIFKIYTKRKNRYKRFNPYKPTTRGKNKFHGETVSAPSNFSLVENAQEVIEFINYLDGLYSRRKPVFVNLTEVENLGYEIIVVLLAVMIKFKNRKIEFNGNYPLNETAKRRLIQSNFFKVLYNRNQKNTAINIGNIKGNGIYTHIKKNVDSKLGSNLISQAAYTIWNEERACKGVQRTLIELMTNTNNHAGKTPGEKNWWLSLSCIEKDKKVIFSFVDFGKGIFKSLLEGKGTVEKWFKWYNELTGKYNNAQILKMILSGEMHETVTGQSHRGKGLPGIYEASKLNSLSNLYIISNDVFADIGNNIYTKMSVNLNGTFVWWEINSKNKSVILKD